MLHRIRLTMQSGSFAKLGGPGNEVEADEAYIGGKPKNMHPDRRAKLRQARESIIGDASLVSKAAIMGVLDREQRKVRTTVVPKINRKVLEAEILSQIHPGSKIYTDEAGITTASQKTTSMTS